MQKSTNYNYVSGINSHILITNFYTERQKQFLKLHEVTNNIMDIFVTKINDYECMNK